MAHANHNAHVFHIVCNSETDKNSLQKYLLEKGIHAYSHYRALHLSPFVENNYPSQRLLPNAKKFAGNLLRLPLYPELQISEIHYIIGCIQEYFKNL